MAVRRANVVPGLTAKRPGNDPAHSVLAGEDLARVSAGCVQLVKWDGLLVRGNLEDGIRGRVDDPLARSLVLLPQLLDDLGARGSLVSEHPPPRLVHEGVDHVVREAMRIGGERLCGDDPHVLPVAGRSVLPLRALDESTGDRRGPGLRRAALEWLDVAETERL